MPISKSARRSLRSSRAKQARNLLWQKTFRRLLKKPGQNLSDVYQAIDKGAKRQLLHWKKAARLKSAMARRLAPKNQP